NQTSNMNIGFVGVGRMGANMARRLVDCGVHVTAVYDVNRAAATKLADELRCAACQDLSEVTAESDVIITVVSDDAAMRKIFAKSWQYCSIRQESWRSGEGKSAGQHGDEHQYRGPG